MAKIIILFDLIASQTDIGSYQKKAGPRAATNLNNNEEYNNVV